MLRRLGALCAAAVGCSVRLWRKGEEAVDQRLQRPVVAHELGGLGAQVLVAGGAMVRILKVLFDATLAEGVQALDDRARLLQVAFAQRAREVSVQDARLEGDLHGVTHGRDVVCARRDKSLRATALVSPRQRLRIVVEDLHAERAKAIPNARGRPTAARGERVLAHGLDLLRDG